MKQIRVTYHYPSWTGTARTWSKSTAAICARSKARRPTSKSSPTGRCATACWCSTTTSKSSSPAAQATSIKGTVHDGERRRVSRRRPRSGTAGAPLRGFLHRGEQGQSARSSHRAARPRLPRQPHRRSHRRRQGRRRIRPERFDASLLGERRPRTDRQPAEAKGREGSRRLHDALTSKTSSWCPAIWSASTPPRKTRAPNRARTCSSFRPIPSSANSPSPSRPAAAVVAAAAGRQSERYFRSAKRKSSPPPGSSRATRSASAQQAAEQGKFLSGVQSKLRDQAIVACRPPAEARADPSRTRSSALSERYERRGRRP